MNNGSEWSEIPFEALPNRLHDFQVKCRICGLTYRISKTFADDITSRLEEILRIEKDYYEKNKEPLKQIQRRVFSSQIHCPVHDGNILFEVAIDNMTLDEFLEEYFPLVLELRKIPKESFLLNEIRKCQNYVDVLKNPTYKDFVYRFIYQPRRLTDADGFKFLQETNLLKLNSNETLSLDDLLLFKVTINVESDVYASTNPLLTVEPFRIQDTLTKSQFLKLSDKISKAIEEIKVN